jgi:hypothetical protein
MAFNRDNAFKYAERFWNIPCDDGLLWLTDDVIVVENKRRELKAPSSDGWQPMFVPDPDGSRAEKAVFRRTVGGKTEDKLINGWAGLADCAHYLSRCLSAGGAATNERGVAQLVQTLQARPDTKTLCEKVPQGNAQRVIDTGIFKKGDMIGYFNVSDEGDYGGRKAYSHSTMFVGKIDTAKVGGVTCHTVSRFPPKSWVEDRWFLSDHYSYTLIHFSVDDLAPAPAILSAIEGWWQLDYSSRTEYYFIFRNGMARYTKRAPRSATETIHAVEGPAYWFLDTAGKITFTWRATGTVEVWSPDSKGNFSSTINGSIPGKLTRLFPPK